VPSADPLRIVHLGLGAFHRAHQAWYLHRLIEAGERTWTIAAGNIRPGMEDTVEALRAQGGEYTLETVAPSGERSYTRIGSLREVIAWQPGIPELVAAAAQAATRIVSFTVTEAGYHLDPNVGLDLAAGEIAADLAAARRREAGITIYGALTAMLRERMRRRAGPLTLLCCDNLRHNGDRVRDGLLQFIEAVGDAELLAWVQGETTLPNSMVDRITPRPTDDVRERVRAATHRDDPAALMTERFSQWVIEDGFAAGRPAWEQVGVDMVASVAAHEEAKIRLLNATHSCIGWAGTLAGTTYIHEGIRDPEILGFARDYLTVDAIPALGASPLDLPGYGASVLERFGSPFIRDTHERVAVDSFSKLGGFVAPTVRDRLRQGMSIDAVAVLPALYLAWLQRWHRGALPYAYRDQVLDAGAAAQLCSGSDPMAALAADERTWGDCAGSERLMAALQRAHARVRRFEAARSTP
jgi:D-arabinitol 4-dehydrogenase